MKTKISQLLLIIRGGKMDIRLEWSYSVPKTKKTHFMKSDWMTVNEALSLTEDLEKTGRLKEITFLDEQDTTWTKKELLKFLTQFETEPHEVIAYIDGGYDLTSNQAGIGLAIYYKQDHKEWRLE